MTTFIRKPEIIKAERYVREGELVPGMCNSQSCYTRVCNKPHVHTIHDNQIVVLEVGDWIVPESDGEHYYPIKDSEMSHLYKRVPEMCPACRQNKPVPEHPGFLCLMCIRNL